LNREYAEISPYQCTFDLTYAAEREVGELE
jgi:hypothetical protein